MSSSHSNREVAAVFAAVAELLEQQGENPFKIKAYRRAVRTLGELNEPVRDIAERGELREIPGFGAAIASKAQEILATGTCELYERLKAAQAAHDVVVVEDEEEELTSSRTVEEADLPSPW